MSLIKEDTRKKKQVNKDNALLEPKKKFETTKDNKKYKVKSIIDSMMYFKEVKN